MSVLVLLIATLWLAGVVGFGVFGYRAGLGLRLFHPVPFSSLVLWPLLLPFCLALRLAERA